MSHISTCLVELHYFPCAHYLSLFFRYQEIQIEAHENYQKRSYRNRCAIIGPNGKHFLSVPLKHGKNSQMPIRQVLISNAFKWREVQWKTIQAAYGSAPYFIHYRDRIETLILENYKTLFAMNHRILCFFKEMWDLPAALTLSTNYNKGCSVSDDFRNRIHLRENATEIEFKTYAQVFVERHGFIPNLSALDLLFCLGPEASNYLLELQKSKEY